MNGTISRKDFDQLSVDGKLGVIFETLQTRDGSCAERDARCDKRFKSIERHKWIDKGVAAGSGFLGGAAAMVAYLFGKGQ